MTRLARRAAAGTDSLLEHLRFEPHIWTQQWTAKFCRGSSGERLGAAAGNSNSAVLPHHEYSCL